MVICPRGHSICPPLPVGVLSGGYLSVYAPGGYLSVYAPSGYLFVMPQVVVCPPRTPPEGMREQLGGYCRVGTEATISVGTSTTVIYPCGHCYVLAQVCVSILLIKLFSQSMLNNKLFWFV